MACSAFFAILNVILIAMLYPNVFNYKQFINQYLHAYHFKNYLFQLFNNYILGQPPTLILIIENQIVSVVRQILFNNKIINNRKKTEMKQSIKKAKRDPILKNIKNLEQTICKAQAKNNAKYRQILKFNANFEFKLFKPVIPSFESREDLTMAESIMMKQIDRLMEDEEKLNIQLDRNQIKFKEQERKIQKQIMHSMDHFTFLRKTWKKDQGNQRLDCKVDKLIHNIGSIKGHILNLIKKQANLSQSAPQIHELIISSPEYCELMKKCEQLKTQNAKLVHQKQQITNNTSQSSIESDQQKKSTEMENQIDKLKKQLAKKDKQIQILMRERGQESDTNTNENGSLSSLEQMDNKILKNPLKRYNVISHNCQFLIIEKQYNKNMGETDQLGNYKNDDNYQQKTIKTKQSLQSILKFLQAEIGSNTQLRRIPRVTLQTAQAREQRGKKYTVEQIARPKFISNRQIISNKANEKELA